MKKNMFLSMLSDYFDTYLPNIRRASENTISAYGYSFSIFFEFLSEHEGLKHTSVNYKNLTPALFDDFVLWMKNNRQYSATSVRQRLTAISSFLKYASQRDMSAIKPYTSLVEVSKPKMARAEFPYFSVEEMKIILGLPNPQKYLGSRDLVFLSLLYDSAARAQEMCDLRVCDIRFGNPTKIRIRGKGRKEREIPVSDDVTSLLKYHFKLNELQNKEKDSPLFISQSDKVMTVACVRSIVAKYVRIAKKTHPDLFPETNYSPHSFRHSKAVHMVEAGIDLIYIRNFLGHEHISTTEIYARIGQEAVIKALTERKIPQASPSVTPHKEVECSLPDFIQRAKNM